MVLTKLSTCFSGPSRLANKKILVNHLFWVLWVSQNLLHNVRKLFDRRIGTKSFYQLEMDMPVPLWVWELHSIDFCRLCIGLAYILLAYLPYLDQEWIFEQWIVTKLSSSTDQLFEAHLFDTWVPLIYDNDSYWMNPLSPLIRGLDWWIST